LIFLLSGFFIKNLLFRTVEASEVEGKKLWSQEEVKKLYRKFNIDLAPKLLYSRGSLVELLISSNIARYTEFRNVSRVVTWHEDKLTPVPCSRADVFSTQNISVVEKRMLMNLLQECTEYESNPDKVKGLKLLIGLLVSN